MKSRPLPSREQARNQTGLHYAFCYAHAVAGAVSRLSHEAGALSAWLDQNAASLGLTAGKTFSDGSSPNATVPVPSWRRLRVTLARKSAAIAREAETPTERWLDSLCITLGLDDAERELLALTLLYKVDQRIFRLVHQISMARGGPSELKCDHALLGLLLERDPGALASVLKPSARLRASGLIVVSRDGGLSALDQLASLVECSTMPGVDFFAQLLGPTLAPTLPWAAFHHLGPEATVVEALLRAAVATKEPGVNILLYGPPGTGKTTFAATVAARVGAALRCVAEQNDYGRQPHRSERATSLTLAQHLAPAGTSILLFDEAEDVIVQDLDDTMFSRVFIHRRLETTPIPVIWTANQINRVNPAILRRMTMCIRFEIPAAAIRARLWHSNSEQEGITLAYSDAVALARMVPAAPAVAAAALRATRLAGGNVETTRLVVKGIAQAMAGGRVLGAEPGPLETYDPTFANADCDLVGLAEALVRPGATRAVSLLLSGPSGSGKSAWARHLATRMGLEVLHKRASDLLGMFVGETEANIAAAFAEARRAGAFLIFDEADSLLGDRAHAVRQWEASQVNEMLTWMEHHPLPFACTTNLPSRLDPASLRRFLVKAQFGWMTPMQARAAFQHFYSLPVPPGLDCLHTLTPADFALVRRRATLMGEEQHAAGLLKQLAGECEGRTATARIGFLQR